MVWSQRLYIVLLVALTATPAAAETVLLEFTSPTCGPCRAMRPVMQQLMAAGYDVREVDTSQEPGLGVAKQYKVENLPTFVVVVDGKERARLVGGGNSAAKLVEMMHTATAIAAQASGELADVVPVAMDKFQAAAADAARAVGGPQPGRVVPIDAQPAVSRSTPAAGSPNAVVDALISATVRLSVDDPDGKSTGTGTIVDAREGKALVLTCGHLFRSSGGKGAIEISLFTPGPNGAELRTTVEGTLIDFDLERDLALVCFAPDAEVAVAPLAAPGSAMAVGHPATSVGCEHGANPTPWSTQITAIDRYQGPPNIEAARAPVEGRSGGGLFNSAGELVGVCNAADPQRDEGLYASLPSIQAKLDALKLSFVYQTPSVSRGQLASRTASPTSTNQPFEVRGQNPTPDTTPTFPPIASTPATAAAPPAAAAASPAATATSESQLSAQDLAMLQEIDSRGGDSEVICIIRPRQAGEQSQILKLDRASPAFVRALGGAATAAAPHTAAAAPAGGPVTR